MTIDSEPKNAVLAELSREPGITATHIGVMANGGVVTLTGQVDWHFEKDAAVHEVRDLSGVVGVPDWITIKPGADVATIGGGITHALHRA